jgi:hypothetical protein
MRKYLLTLQNNRCIMAINFTRDATSKSVKITETGKPNIYLMGYFYGVMTNNDAGTHINVRDGDYNITFAVADIGTINGTAGPWTLADALHELEQHVFKL